MHSFHPSRGRIFFEVLCALILAASFAAAWLQTGASALLPAAAVALLYALVHAFDMRRRTPVLAADPQRIEVESEVKRNPPPDPEAEVHSAGADQPLPWGTAPEEAELVEPAAPPAEAGRRKGGSRKGNGRRASAPKVAKLVAPAPAEVAEVAPQAPEEPEVATFVPPAEVDVSEFAPPDEAARVPHAPLFEPEPFARQQRAVFGRKAG